ncbi:MAG: NTP transferase domain-containing protein [Planctomycetes bacterium]|nr:NTP transferase domain-containing protein [Planctomycetota bacterium]
MRYAVIMAGGSGTRLWPMSTAALPKQLIPFINGKSLLEVAADRLEGLVDAERIYICTGEKFRGVIRKSLPRFSEEQILGEPMGRDTLAAVGLPGAVLDAADPDATIAVFTADHLIEPVDVFQQRVNIGYEIVEQDAKRIVTFGIKPTHAETGYGYVQLGEPVDGNEHCHHTGDFKEKPDADTAERYYKDGRYLWNAGMFIWRASTLMDCIARYEPDVHAGLMKIAEAWHTKRRRKVLEEVYPTLRKISVDYAVLEPASKDAKLELITVDMPVKWLDVGGWPAYGKTLKPDETGNRAGGEAKVITLGSADNLVVSDEADHVIALLGVSDLTVIHTGKSTLICSPDAADMMKELYAKVKEMFGEEYV